MAPRKALKGRMLQVATPGQYESPIKALLSGLRLAEKMAIIPTIVVPADWMFAAPLGRLRISRNPRNIRWAEEDIIYLIAKRKDTLEWKELECLGLAVLSLTNLLRIGEATVSSPGDGKLASCFLGEKLRSGEHDQDLGPWPSRWMHFIKEERHKHGVAEDRPHGYHPPANLEEAGVALVARSELEHYRWHCLRRGGATQPAGVGRTQSNRHARRWVGITVSGKALHKAKACVEVYGEGGAAGAGMWRKRVLPRVWGLVLQAVVASMVAKRAQRTGGGGTDRWRCFGTGWTGRPQKEKDPISRAARGKVDVNGRIIAAWGRSWNWERSWTWTRCGYMTRCMRRRELGCPKQ